MKEHVRGPSKHVCTWADRQVRLNAQCAQNKNNKKIKTKNKCKKDNNHQYASCTEAHKTYKRNGKKCSPEKANAGKAKIVSVSVNVSASASVSMSVLGLGL